MPAAPEQQNESWDYQTKTKQSKWDRKQKKETPRTSQERQGDSSRDSNGAHRTAAQVASVESFFF